MGVSEAPKKASADIWTLPYFNGSQFYNEKYHPSCYTYLNFKNLQWIDTHDKFDSKNKRANSVQTLDSKMLICMKERALITNYLRLVSTIDNTLIWSG